LAGIRIFNGAVGLFAADQMAERLGGDLGDDKRFVYPARMFGIRTLVLGVDLLTLRTSDASARRALKEFYLAEARADIGRWLPNHLPTFPRAPTSIRVRPLSSLWGSLSARDALSLDLSLVLGKPAAFEYVLVHELCHLIHRNHARGFWREVEARGQDWRAQRDYLHGEGAALKASLRRLLAPN